MYRFFSIVAPMAAAWLIGDMANNLLYMNKSAIFETLPIFLIAVLLQVFGETIAHYILNIQLTQKGFAYDCFLMDRLIRLPISALQSENAGAVMTRFEEDSADFVWNQMVIYSFPSAILINVVIFVFMMIQSKTHILFAVTIVIFAAMPAFRASYVGKLQMRLKKESAVYREHQNQMEQELYNARDFACNYFLGKFFIGRLQTLFENFLNQTGKIKRHVEAKNQVLDFLCEYGVSLGALLVGILLIVNNHLTIGAMLSGYLMIPVVQQGFKLVKEWVTSYHEEEKYLSRLDFFYTTLEESSDKHDTLQFLRAQNITFQYEGTAAPVLYDVNFTMDQGQNFQIIGENGSGKTTFLMLLAGLYSPTSGTICNGSPLSILRDNIAFQEQDGAVFSGSVWENLFLPQEKFQQAENLLSNMGFEKPLDYQVTSEGGNLSPGERKKLLLVRAMLRDKPFLLLDEPLNHLDQQGRKVLVQYLRVRKTGTLVISHDPYLTDQIEMNKFYV